MKAIVFSSIHIGYLTTLIVLSGAVSAPSFAFSERAGSKEEAAAPTKGDSESKPSYRRIVSLERISNYEGDSIYGSYNNQSIQDNHPSYVYSLSGRDFVLGRVRLNEKGGGPLGLDRKQQWALMERVKTDQGIKFAVLDAGEHQSLMGALGADSSPNAKRFADQIRRREAQTYSESGVAAILQQAADAETAIPAYTAPENARQLKLLKRPELRGIRSKGEVYGLGSSGMSYDAGGKEGPVSIASLKIKDPSTNKDRYLNIFVRPVWNGSRLEYTPVPPSEYTSIVNTARARAGDRTLPRSQQVAAKEFLDLVSYSRVERTGIADLIFVDENATVATKLPVEASTFQVAKIEDLEKAARQAAAANSENKPDSESPATTSAAVLPDECAADEKPGFLTTLLQSAPVQRMTNAVNEFAEKDKEAKSIIFDLQTATVNEIPTADDISQVAAIQQRLERDPKLKNRVSHHLVSGLDQNQNNYRLLETLGSSATPAIPALANRLKSRAAGGVEESEVADIQSTFRTYSSIRRSAQQVQERTPSNPVATQNQQNFENFEAAGENVVLASIRRSAFSSDTDLLMESAKATLSNERYQSLRLNRAETQLAPSQPNASPEFSRRAFQDLVEISQDQALNRDLRTRAMDLAGSDSIQFNPGMSRNQHAAMIQSMIQNEASSSSLENYFLGLNSTRTGLSTQDKEAFQFELLQEIGNRTLTDGQASAFSRRVVRDSSTGRRLYPDRFHRFSYQQITREASPESTEVALEYFLKLPEKDALTIAALGNLGQNGASAVPTLESILTSASSSNLQRMSALDSLGKMGPAAGSSVKTVMEQLKSSQFGVRRSAAKALLSFGAATQPYRAQLERTMGSESDNQTRQLLAQVLQAPSVRNLASSDTSR